MTIYKEEGSWVYPSMFVKTSWCQTQRPPYRKPLPYTTCVGRKDNGSQYAQNFGSIPLINGFDRDRGVAEAGNKALSKVYDKLGQVESLRVAWIERQKSLDMVANRLGSLIKLARAVRNRDPHVVRRVLRRKPNARDIVKQPASLWLEYWFGWAPMISDIHHALNIFSQEYPWEPLRASSGAFEEFHYNRNSEYDRIQYWAFTTRVKIGGRITAINPDIGLATQLGFGQPLSVAWELMPFSWCIDYVVNVSELAKNLEPQFPGITLADQFTTRFIKCEGYVGYRNDEPPTEVPLTQGSSIYMNRSIGWPPYRLVFSNPLGLSGQRVSYLASVLVQILSGMRRS